MFELWVRRDGEAQHAIPLGSLPVRVGRAAGCGVVLDDETVSGHHAELWVEAGAAWVRDLVSRNGTFVNDERTRGAVRLDCPSVVRFGARMEVEVRGQGTTAGPRLLHLEDADSGVRFLLRSTRFHVGSDAQSDLRLHDGPARAATLVRIADDEVWLGLADSERPLPLNEIFEVGGRRLRLVESSADWAPTIEFGIHRYPYVVNAMADGPTGHQARLTDPERREIVLTGNRGVLMWVLARQLAADRAAGKPEAEEGWIADATVATAVWGAAWRDANTLHVLVYRLRKFLEGEGFDPWFIEKRHWGLRVRLASCTVDNPGAVG